MSNISVKRFSSHNLATSSERESRRLGKKEFSSLKRSLVRVIEATGLMFLIPVVRLAFGEEPQRQIREMGRLIVIPTIAFCLFIGLWALLAPQHKTKSGEVPTPAVVWDAAHNIWLVHQREAAKERAFLSTGEQREQELEGVKQRLLVLAKYEQAARDKVAELEKQEAKRIAQTSEEMEQKRLNRLAETAGREQQRIEQLTILAERATAGDLKIREEYLRELRNHRAATEQDQALLAALDVDLARIRDTKSPALRIAKNTFNKIAEEVQYLKAIEDQLSTSNRSVRLAEQITALRNDQRAFLVASADQMDGKATRVLQAEQRVASTSTATYAKPWTLPLQIARSVACVFVGFLIGTIVAIPIGILCGLNDAFMAAMTPFIALFKPVSPIVWLPIALIIVGGFITDPESNWLLVAINSIPGISWLKVNPAFIASAITVSLCSLWATLVNTALGVASVNRDFLNVARVLQLGFWSRLFKIIIPSALPLMFAGLRISLGVGWMVLVAGELLSSSEGIGKFVWDQFNNGAADSFAKMIVVVFVVGGIGLLLDRLMVVVQRLFSFDIGNAAI